MIITALLLAVALSYKIKDETELKGLFNLTFAIINIRLLYIFYFLIAYHNKWSEYTYLGVHYDDYSFLMNVDVMTLTIILSIVFFILVIGLVINSLSYILTTGINILHKIGSLFK